MKHTKISDSKKSKAFLEPKIARQSTDKGKSLTAILDLDKVSSKRE